MAQAGIRSWLASWLGGAGTHFVVLPALLLTAPIDRVTELDSTTERLVSLRASVARVLEVTSEVEF